MLNYLKRLPAILPAAVLLIGCPNEQADPIPLDPEQNIDLVAALGVLNPEVVGVTVDPVSGQRYLLDQFEGIFELQDDNSATLLRSIEELPTPQLLPRSLWTDFVALGDGLFAITALSDGYLLDLEGETLTEYFCYVPEDMPWEEDQLTHSVAFDPELGVIYAQPITFERSGLDEPDPFASSVGSYSLAGGQPTAWFGLDDPDFLAGGSAVDSDGSLLLGRDTELYRFYPASGQQPELVGQLPARTQGPSEWLAEPRIEAMAVDAGRGELLVVDASVDLLLRVPLSDL